jgi:hypothetical protein
VSRIVVPRYLEIGFKGGYRGCPRMRFIATTDATPQLSERGHEHSRQLVLIGVPQIREHRIVRHFE